MYTKIPPLSGKQLIKLLRKDGWAVGRKTKHGITLTKPFEDQTRVTFVPDTRAILPIGTLMAILGYKQTGLRRRGLLKIINKYGI